MLRRDEEFPYSMDSLHALRYPSSHNSGGRGRQEAVRIVRPNQDL